MRVSSDLLPSPISLKIGGWARKAGVSIHPHSLRHKFATYILDRGGNIRAVQQLLGHEILGTTETYLAVTNNGLQTTVNLLDKGWQNKKRLAVLILLLTSHIVRPLMTLGLQPYE